MLAMIRVSPTHSVGRFGISSAYFCQVSVSVSSWFGLLRVVSSIIGCICLGCGLDKCLSGLGLFVACEPNAMVLFLIVSCFTSRGGILFFWWMCLCVSAWLCVALGFGVCFLRATRYVVSGCMGWGVKLLLGRNVGFIQFGTSCHLLPSCYSSCSVGISQRCPI